MSEHTKEPWVNGAMGIIKAGPVIEYVNGSAQSQIAMTVGAEWMAEGEQYENARRIVACVNACAGIPIAHLESHFTPIHKISALEQQRDELLAELLKVARMAEALKRECGMNPESPQAIRNGEYMNISYVARAAIAKVKP